MAPPGMDGPPIWARLSRGTKPTVPRKAGRSRFNYSLQAASNLGLKSLFPLPKQPRAAYLEATDGGLYTMTMAVLVS